MRISQQLLVFQNPAIPAKNRRERGDGYARGETPSRFVHRHPMISSGTAMNLVRFCREKRARQLGTRMIKGDLS
jgi:hypothetical protein